MNKPQLDVRMEYAESILRGLPKTAPTIAIDSILTDYEAKDREEVLESIQAYADIRARQAIFVIYEAARATAEQSRDSVIEECATACLGEIYTPNVGEYRIAYNRGVEDCVSTIRALKHRNGA